MMSQAARLEGEAASLTDAQRELYRSERLGVWTKLRPGEMGIGTWG